ncbi:SDR family oxidoreductase [Gracilibacillus salinarum]|uniref:SDR family oxidoreductase n=1 Tax=Gracilibacillus salinarum TaxID=2932255 RepID=A0ABY4GKU2_9BACI|nr:SDR family oxidoreductase [Gracilibacillus salinarum]UOQ84985.1 SDR family oxidoreductase [Gracilibacillus salinarum]
MKLQNKVAIVTGAASGMGKAIAERFSQEGAAVVLADLNAEGVNTLANEINDNGGKAKAVEVNIANLDDINKMIEAAVNEFGTLDILVNNAGIMDGFEPVAEVDDDRWDLIFDINTKGVMRAMRKAIPVFLEKGQGVIINTASSGGLNGAHAGATYTASKHAVIGLTKNTAFMYAQKGIRCNAIAPGAVATNISSSMKNVSQFGSERLKLGQSLIPNVGSPKDIANVALFLASDEAAFVNGTTITADAGWTSAF